MAAPTQEQLDEITRQIKSGRLDPSRVKPEVLAMLNIPQETQKPASPSRPYVEGEGRLNKIGEVRRALNVGLENLGAQAIGLGELAATAATGAFAQPAAGLRGLYDLATKPKGAALSAAVNAINEVSGSYTYQPRTQAGQSQAGAAATLFSPITEGVDYLGEKTAETTGSAALGAGVKTLLEVGPAFFGVQNPIRYIRSNAAVAKEARDIISKSGIDPNLPVGEQIAKVPEAASLLANHARETARNFESIQQGVARQHDNMRSMVSSMYKEAEKAGSVSADINQVKVLDGAIADSVATYDPLLIRPVMAELERFSSMIRPTERTISGVKIDPVPGRRLGGLPDKLERILTRNEYRGKSSGGASGSSALQRSVIELNDIADFRRRISNLARSSDNTVSGAATSIKYHIDKWFDAQLTSDLLSGSSVAITKWKSANTAFKDYFDMFRAEKAIDNLVKAKATPEDVKNWIYGASAMGAKSHAGIVVGKLKGILGENSPEFSTLKQGVMYDIVSPLLDENLAADAVSSFRKNLLKVKQDRPTLWKEVFSSEEIGALDSLNKMLYSAGEIKGRKPFAKDMNQAIATVLFPKAHPLRTGQVTLQVIDATIDRIRNIGAGSAQQQYIAGLTGNAVSGGMFSAKTPAMAAFIQTMDDEEAASISDIIRRLSGGKTTPSSTP